jgi:hypothetical protein
MNEQCWNANTNNHLLLFNEADVLNGSYTEYSPKGDQMVGTRRARMLAMLELGPFVSEYDKNHPQAHAWAPFHRDQADNPTFDDSESEEVSLLLLLLTSQDTVGYDYVNTCNSYYYKHLTCLMSNDRFRTKTSQRPR